MLRNRHSADKDYEEEMIRRYKRWKAAQPKPEEPEEESQES